MCGAVKRFRAEMFAESDVDEKRHWVATGLKKHDSEPLMGWSGECGPRVSMFKTPRCYA